jgi:DNA-binding beta-propeller fold protein YncE
VTLIRTDGGAEPVLATLEVGRQPSGVSFGPEGSYALVANRGDGSVSVLAIDGDVLREKTRIGLGTADDSLAHIEVSPDGKWALATFNATDVILLLRLDAEGTPAVVQRLSAGRGPYGARFFPDGRGAVVAHIGSDELVSFDLKEDALVEAGRLAVGRIPEGIDISGDGTRVAVSCLEGFALFDPAHPRYGQPARVILLKHEGNALVKVDEIAVPGGPQFAIFTPDGGHLLVAETSFRRLRVFRCDEGKLIATDQVLPLPGEPVAAQRATAKPGI